MTEELPKMSWGDLARFVGGPFDGELHKAGESAKSFMHMDPKWAGLGEYKYAGRRTESPFYPPVFLFHWKGGEQR